jgi:hypothetical protein
MSCELSHVYCSALWQYMGSTKTDMQMTRHFNRSDPRLSRIMALILSLLPSVADSDGRPDCTSTVTHELSRTWLSTHTHFTPVNHCFHILLNAYDGFLPLVHLQPTKIIITARCFFFFFFLVHTGKGTTMLTLLWRHCNWSAMVERGREYFPST